MSAGDHPEDPFRFFNQGGVPDAGANDTRFQFEVIKGLSDSIRQLAGSMADMQRTQVGMLERLAVLEANKIGDLVTAHAADIKALEDRVGALFTDKNQRDGAAGVFGFFLKYGPVIFSLFAALWLFGRSLGVVPVPPANVPTVRADAIVREERHIENAIGGNP